MSTCEEKSDVQGSLTRAPRAMGRNRTSELDMMQLPHRGALRPVNAHCLSQVSREACFVKTSSPPRVSNDPCPDDVPTAEPTSCLPTVTKRCSIRKACTPKAPTAALPMANMSASQQLAASQQHHAWRHRPALRDTSPIGISRSGAHHQTTPAPCSASSTKSG